MKKVSLIFSLLIAFSALLSCAEKKTAKEVKIGDQIWMTENLNVDHFRNGDAIPEARTAEEWEKAGENHQPAWCYYDNDPSNGDKYGKLYNWYAVNDPRGLAPTGWHVPSYEEWTILTNYLDGNEVAGNKMKSKSGWDDDGNGSNSSGFEGLPGGSRYFEGGSFYFIGSYGYWWSSTEGNTFNAWSRSPDYFKRSVSSYDLYKYYGLSVRCLRD